MCARESWPSNSAPFAFLCVLSVRVISAVCGVGGWSDKGISPLSAFSIVWWSSAISSHVALLAWLAYFYLALSLHCTGLFSDPRFSLFVLQNIADYKNDIKCG